MQRHRLADVAAPPPPTRPPPPPCNATQHLNPPTSQQGFSTYDQFVGFCAGLGGGKAGSFLHTLHHASHAKQVLPNADLHSCRPALTLCGQNWDFRFENIVINSPRHGEHCNPLFCVPEWTKFMFQFCSQAFACHVRFLTGTLNAF